MHNLHSSKLRQIKQVSKQDQEMNELVKKYMSTCDQGQKLNIGAYLKDVCTTNKSFFYPDNLQLCLDGNPTTQDPGSQNRRSSLASSAGGRDDGQQHSTFDEHDGKRNSSMKSSSRHEGSSAVQQSQMSKKQMLKEQAK